jgi:thiol:disulfide interchange protein DsbD
VSRGLQAEPFSATRLAALIAAGKPVFVDVTAAWCLTCKYNETVALSDPGVAEAFRARGVVYLLGDWTNGNPELSGLLRDYGRNGVPLSLFFAPGAQRGQILPQILTPKIVVDTVNAAALPRS